MKEKSILDKPLFDIALDVLGWGITTAFKGAKAGITAIADSLPTEANKEKKREEEHQKTLNKLEAARRSIIDAMVADRRNRDIPLEEPIEETCFHLLYDKTELLTIAKKIARYNTDAEVLGKRVSEIVDYKDLPIKTYKEFFDFKYEAKKVLSASEKRAYELEVAEEKRREEERLVRIANEEFLELMEDLNKIPNFKTRDPYKVNYKNAISANKRISEFLEEYPNLDAKNSDTLKELIDFTNKVYELNKYKIEQDEKAKQEERRKKAEADAKYRAELEQEALEDFTDSINGLRGDISDVVDRLR
jgi:hypothetical protein|nr:MAG TPA: hypothetical protein [Caudoviricetes sp.]